MRLGSRGCVFLGPNDLTFGGVVVVIEVCL